MISCRRRNAAALITRAAEPVRARHSSNVLRSTGGAEDVVHRALSRLYPRYLRLRMRAQVPVQPRQQALRVRLWLVACRASLCPAMF